MLADLEDLNFSLEQLLVFQVEFLFLNDFDCDFLERLFVNASLDDAVLSLAQGFLKFVKVEDVGVAYCLLNGVHPSIFLSYPK